MILHNTLLYIFSPFFANDMFMKRKIVRVLIFMVLAVTAVSAAFLIDVYVSMPPYDEKKLYYIDYSLEIYDKDAQTVSFSLSESGNMYVELETLPEYLKQAFILAEDKNFYSHRGVDMRRVAGAIVNNIFHPDKLQGASTITQQLIKNTHLNSGRTIKRKLQEVRLARTLEKKHTKDEIFESYLNTVYYGNKAYGIGKAAKIYFNKSAADLSPAESATLAAIIKGPSVYAPNVNKEKCLVRRDYILGLLQRENVISEAEYNEAIKTDIDTSKISTENLYKNAYCDAAISEAAELLSTDQNTVCQSGLKIYTYMDAGLQNEAEKFVYEKHKRRNARGKAADNAVIILDNKTAGVSAFAGRGSENLYSMKRQPGSCIKPSLVYVPALEENLITPLTFLYDAKTEYGNYSPANYNNKYYGWVSTKRAVEMSLNSPAVALFQMTGIEKAKQIAAKSGIRFSEKDDGLALGLGGFTYGVTVPELAGSYAAIANAGAYKPTRFIAKIVSADGKILYENTTAATRAMRSDTAYLMTSILEGVAENGTARHLKGLDYAVAAKTGTVGTESGTENTDAWLMSYTTNHTVGIWYGAPEGKEQLLDNSLTGGSLSSAASEIFDILYKDKKPTAFSRPESVRCVYVDTVSLGRNKVELAAPETPDRYKQKAYFSVFNMPSRVASCPYNLLPAKGIAG